MNTWRPADDCRHCPALAANRRYIVHGYGPQPARVLFVGEAPGYLGADRTGVPFTRDRSGRRLQQLLIDVGLSEESGPGAERPRLRCFVTNVVRCNPPGNRRPAPIEVENCRPYLWAEMAAVRPEIVVPVGGLALNTLAPELLGRPAPPITAAHAQVWPIAPHTPAGLLPLDAVPRLMIPLRHPARISNADLARFAGVLRAALEGDHDRL